MRSLGPSNTSGPDISVVLDDGLVRIGHAAASRTAASSRCTTDASALPDVSVILDAGQGPYGERRSAISRMWIREPSSADDSKTTSVPSCAESTVNGIVKSKVPRSPEPDVAISKW